MKRIKVVDLFGVPYREMEAKINNELEALQNDGMAIVSFRVIGDSLNKGAVFIMYDDE